MATSYRLRAASRAVAAPMPRLPPVINMTGLGSCMARVCRKRSSVGPGVPGGSTTLSAVPDDLSPHAKIATDLLHGRSRAGFPRVSPDGEHVACVVATIDLEENLTNSRVWLD